MVIFLYGPDAFRAREKLDELKQKFLERNGGKKYLITSMDGEDFDLADFRNKVLSAGFFAEKKMVVFRMRNAKCGMTDDAKCGTVNDELLEILRKIPEETALAVWHKGEDEKFLRSELGKFLLRQKYVFRFVHLFGNALVGWIRERAGRYGCAIDNEAAFLVCDILGNDLRKIDLELNKLCAYACSVATADPGGGKSAAVPKITKKTIERLLVREAEENMFKFIDALAQKNKRLALLALQNEFDAGVSEFAILGMIARQVRILLQVKSMDAGTGHFAIAKESVAKELGIHPYVAQKALGQAKNFNINELKNIHRQLLAIDMSIKSSGAPARALFDRMICKL